MKLNFGKYTREIDDSIISKYNGLNDAQKQEAINKDWGYDSKHYNTLLNNREFEKAYEYASQFKMVDPIQQRARENNLINLRREGRKMSAIFSNITNDDEKSQTEFYLNVFSNNGLEKLNNNQYAKQFIEFKNKIGGEEATSIGITFAPEKRTFLGIDWLALDNRNNIDAFYSTLGLNKEDLEKEGVNVSEKDGYTTLKFDKSNKYANYILANIKDVLGAGYVDLGRSIEQNDKSLEFETNVKLMGYDSNGNPVELNKDTRHQRYYINQLQNLINNSKETTEKYTKPLEIEKVYSSTIGGFIEDGLEELRDKYAKGYIDRPTYKQAMEERYSSITSVLKSLGSANYEIYGNSYNDKSTDGTLVPLDNMQREYAVSEISSSDDFSLNTMISGGKIGTLVTIYGIPEDKKNIDMDSNSEESLKRVRHQFFIPGLFHDKAQAAINADTSVRASQELNEMQDWGYTYTLSDGSKLSHKSGSIFELNGKKIDISEAKKAITKEFMIENAVGTLKYQFMDANGNINKKNYSDMLKIYTIRCINELYPEIPLIDMNYQKLDINNIFNMKGVGSAVASEYIPNVNMDVNYKLTELYKLYDYLIDNMNKN